MCETGVRSCIAIFSLYSMHDSAKDYDNTKPDHIFQFESLVPKLYTEDLVGPV